MILRASVRSNLILNHEIILSAATVLANLQMHTIKICGHVECKVNGEHLIGHPFTGKEQPLVPQQMKTENSALKPLPTHLIDGELRGPESWSRLNCRRRCIST